MSKKNTILCITITVVAFMIIVLFALIIFADYEENEPYDEFNATYIFTGKSEHFKFDFGRVYFSPDEQKIAIRDFKQIVKIENLKSEKLTIYFNDDKWMSLENTHDLNKLNEYIEAFKFYEAGMICSSDSGIECEKTAFSLVDESNFKNIIKIEMEYCIKNGDCYVESFNLNYSK